MSRVCFHGRDGTGSHEVRARQVADGHPGWWATTRLAPDDYIDADVVVFVKRIEPRKMRLLRALGKRVVVDLLDDWRQPEDDVAVRDVAEARALFGARLRDLPADAVIYPTRAMQEDLGDLLPPGVVIHHHARPGLEPGPLRERARRVGYEGDVRFLGPWHDELRSACGALGLELVTNPADLREVDLGVTARGGVFAGHLALRYKSGVKVANLCAAGVPCLIQRELVSALELGLPGARAFSTPGEMREALAALLPLEARRAAREALLGAAPRFALATIRGKYEELLARLRASVAAE